MTLIDAWMRLSWSSAAIVPMVGALLIFAGILIGSTNGKHK